MPSGIPTNRTNIDLPAEVSREIIQKTQESSMIMQLATQISLPGRGLQIPVISGDPEAQWVEETGKKPVSNPSLAKKVMTGHKLAVIVPFSNEFRRDAAALYDALIARLPGVLSKKFDATVFHGPDSGTLANFDNLASVTAHSLTADPYAGLVNADVAINEAGGMVNGYVFSPQGRGLLLSAVDGQDRPLFLNSVSDDAIPRILGAPTYFTSAVYKDGDASTADVVGFAGDWSKAMYGVVSGVTIDYSSDASLTYVNTDNQTVTINLFEQNMFAVRAEMEVGFIAQTEYFAKLTRVHQGE